MVRQKHTYDDDQHFSIQNNFIDHFALTYSVSLSISRICLFGCLSVCLPALYLNYTYIT